MVALLFVGILILTLETGCLLTLYEGAFYSRKLKLWEILEGGFFLSWAMRSAEKKLAAGSSHSGGLRACKPVSHIPDADPCKAS